MIINVRGTSGSGKSTLVRAVMARYSGQEFLQIDGRRQPIGYNLHRLNNGRSLHVVGHYETACGGADTISTGFDYIYRLVDEAHNKGLDVLFEGLLLNSDTRRCIETHNKFGGDMRVVALTVPVEICVASINERRAARGKTEPVNPANTEAKAKVVLSQSKKFREALGDHYQEFSDRDAALAYVLKELGW